MRAAPHNGRICTCGVDSKNRKSYRWPLTSNSDLRGCLEGVRIVYDAVHNLSIAASGGIQSSEDAVDAIQLGANVVMITSTIYQQAHRWLERSAMEFART